MIKENVILRVNIFLVYMFNNLPNMMRLVFMLHVREQSGSMAKKAKK